MSASSPEPPNVARLESHLARLLGWISAADAKITPVLAVNTASLGALAALAAPVRKWDIWLALGTAVTLVLLALSFLHVFLAAFPRTHGPKGSLVFFGGITERTEDEFVGEILNVQPGEYTRDLARQCYRNAEIAGEKFHHVKLATTFLLGALLPWAVTIYFMYGAR